MDELMANLSLGLDPLGPVDNAQVGRAAARNDLFPLAERRIARPGPAPRIMAVGARPAPILDVLQVQVDRLRYIVQEQELAEGAIRPSLRAGAIVRHVMIKVLSSCPISDRKETSSPT